MIPALVISLGATLVFAYYLGLSERRRLAKVAVATGPELAETDLIPRTRKVIQPRNFWFNLGLTIVLMASLALGLALAAGPDHGRASPSP